MIITVIAVVVALLAAGLVFFLAKKNTDDAAGGQSTPVEAATQLLSSLSDKDALGIAEGLDPTEAHLFADMSGDVLTQLKRLGVVNDTVSSTSAGTTVTSSGMTVDPTPIVINDHVSVVELTGGTVTVKSGSGTLPFSDKILQAFPQLKESAKVDDTTINIADEVSQARTPDPDRDRQPRGQVVRLGVLYRRGQRRLCRQPQLQAGHPGAGHRRIHPRGRHEHPDHQGDRRRHQRRDRRVDP